MMGPMTDTALWNVAVLILGALIGSLPLGSLLIRRLTGRDAATFSAHNLGVENMIRFVGARVALAAFMMDIVKGFVAVALGLGSPWAALGVFLGHLHPLPLAWPRQAARGRGNGVLLGILAGLVTFSALPFWAGLLPVLAYSMLLALTGYVALASLAGLGTLAALVLFLPLGSGFIAMAFALLAVAVWRHKSSLTRIIDRTEARLGDPPPVRGSDPRIVRAAFMVHPLTLPDLWQPRSLQWLHWLFRQRLINETLLKRITPYLRPLLHAEFTGIELPDGRELRVMIITGPLLPDQIREQPELATRMAIQGARLARDLGAEAFGLGAFWSTVGNKGMDVQEAVPDIAITNGGAYTAASVKAAVPGLLQSFSEAGGSLGSSTAAVVGANGVVAFGVARSIAADVGRLILIGRDLERLERSAESLRRRHPQTQVLTSTEMDDVRDADLVFTATSDPDPVLFAQHIKPGAWIFDLGRPADVADSVLQVPGVHIVPGGVVRPPGAMRTNIDIHFGDGMVPACMAETMIMTATRAFDRASLGPSTRSANIDFYLEEAERLGFQVITRDERLERLDGAERTAAGTVSA
jgi:acyl-phosphate glycerol 3-phosphate acyltransferase